MNTLSKVALDIADFLRAEQPMNSPNILSISQTDAMRLIMEWQKEYQKSPNKFKNFYNIDFNDFILRLAILIDSPYLLNQGAYGLCAMSSTLYIILKARPDAIVRYAMQLYNTGVGKLGDLEVKPNATFRSQNFEQVVQMNIVDPSNGKSHFIGPDLLMMGALRDSENILPFDFYDNSLPSNLMNRISDGGSNDEIVGILNRTKLFKSVNLVSAKSNLKFIDFDNEIRKHKHVVLSFYSTGKTEKVMENEIFSIGKHQCALEYNYILSDSTKSNCYNFVFITWGLKIFQSVEQKNFNDSLINYILID